MNRIWSRSTLRYVDAWACRDGCPEDDEDIRHDAPAVTQDRAMQSSDPEKAVDSSAPDKLD